MLRGLSTRDVEAALRDATRASLLSRTAVSQVTLRLWQEYQAFATRDLSEFAVAYLFVDGVAERLHAGLPREAVWRLGDHRGRLQGAAAPGARTKKDTASCTAFFEDLTRRTKIIPHVFGERPVLKLMYAPMGRAADRWRGITVGEFEQRQLRVIREQLDRAGAWARRWAHALEER